MGTGDGSLIWKDIRTSVLTTFFLEPTPSQNEAILEVADHDDCEDLNNYSAPENDDAEDFSGKDDDPDLHSDWECEENESFQGKAKAF
ncbi:unnamed protein product [Orchesella dallaii]|uniref:Uncharacterized protein n=1 Tax=Orchesella dallaii TaxID=48710 RepID=A0ABP1PV98_9HEXA